MTSRRAFLFGATAALAAPSIVRAESLMKLWVPKPKLLTEQTLLEAMTAISDWVHCDGRALSRALYADLFKVVGTTYGVGNGRDTFNVPDFRPSLGGTLMPPHPHTLDPVEFVVRAKASPITPVGFVGSRIIRT